MKILAFYVLALLAMLIAFSFAERSIVGRFCLCWPPLQNKSRVVIHHTGKEFVAGGSYGTEGDWNSPDRIILLNYNEDQGKRLFYQHCVWCHADTTPAGPSNRGNVSPEPPVMNDGAVFNRQSDGALEKIIALGGSALGKSAMMPAYGATLSRSDIRDLVAYIRKIASPANTQASLNTKESPRSNPQ